MTRKIERLERIGELSPAAKWGLKGLVLVPVALVLVLVGLNQVQKRDAAIKEDQAFVRRFLGRSYASENEFLGLLSQTAEVEGKASYKVDGDLVANYIEANGVTIRYVKRQSSGSLMMITEVPTKRYDVWVEFDETQALAASGDNNEALLDQLKEMRSEHPYLGN